MDQATEEKAEKKTLVEKKSTVLYQVQWCATLLLQTTQNFIFWMFGEMVMFYNTDNQHNDLDQHTSKETKRIKELN